MARWILKAALQGVMSRLPDPQLWNRLFQQHVTKSLVLRDDFVVKKWATCLRHIESCRETQGTGLAVMELGTGWYPIVPIGLALNGASRVLSVDSHHLLDRHRVTLALQTCGRLLDQDVIESRAGDAAARVRDVLKHAEDKGPTEILAELGIESIVADARSTSLPEGSISLFVSNNTLEHIPAQTIHEIFEEFSRIGTADAVMSHHIDLEDHYSHFDKSINEFNFLKYPARRWAWLNNDLQYQNRLRVPDYRELHANAGWRILEEESKSGSPEKLDAIRLAPEFRHYSPEDLLVYESWMVSVKNARPE